MGVRGVDLKKEGDGVVGMVILDPASNPGTAPDILTVCDKGYGKRTPLEEYRLQGRGGSGIINCKVTDKTGLVASVGAVKADDHIMVVTDRGMMIRVTANTISLLSRATQGVRVISVEDKESVASVAMIAERDDVEEA
jgi:DNA gyrase subunit A